MRLRLYEESARRKEMPKISVFIPKDEVCLSALSTPVLRACDTFSVTSKTCIKVAVALLVYTSLPKSTVIAFRHVTTEIHAASSML